MRHGFFTREGGVSEGLYASLNCGHGSNDLTRRVDENRRRVAAAMGLAPDRLFTPYQVHSAAGRPRPLDAASGRSGRRGHQPPGDRLLAF